jgi:hypothetical protein
LTTTCGKCCAVLGLLWGIMGVKINKNAKGESSHVKREGVIIEKR